MEDDFSVPCPEILRDHLQQFFGSLKIHGSPPPKCSLGTGSHKPAGNIQCTLEMIQDGEQWKTDRC